MSKQIQIFIGLTFVLSYFFVVPLIGQETRLPVPFAIASVHFEQNATDGDVEVVFEVKGSDEGLAKLTVVSPDGRTVVDFEAPDASTLGIRQFRFESPEPGDVNRLKSAYPEGHYIFAGTTTTGNRLDGKSTLSHTLPTTISFIHPLAEADNINHKSLEIIWTPVNNLAAYIVEIEQDEMDIKIIAKLSTSKAKFTVPDGFLVPEKEYTLGIGTVNEEGNISFVETSFTTAKIE